MNATREKTIAKLLAIAKWALCKKRQSSDLNPAKESQNRRKEI